VIYLVMAAVQAVGLLAWWTMREPVAVSPPSFRAAVVEPLREYQARRGQGLILAVFAFAILYKLGDSLAGNVTMAFLLREGGFTLKELALIQNTWGLLATLIGVALGGLGMLRLGLNRSLWIFGVLQGASNLAYAGLAQWGGGTGALALVVTIENLCGGMGAVAFVAFLSAECAPAYAATQFALLSSLMAAGRDGLASTAGVLKEGLQLNWPEFYLLTAVAAIPGILLLPWVAGWSTRPLADRTIQTGG
jgi:PAT family beta-lactamase induction signal transducer AmpG